MNTQRRMGLFTVLITGARSASEMRAAMHAPGTPRDNFSQPEKRRDAMLFLVGRIWAFLRDFITRFGHSRAKILPRFSRTMRISAAVHVRWLAITVPGDDAPAFSGRFRFIAP